MKALSQEEIQNICNLYKVYGNLRDVSKVTSRSLGTLHKYTSLYSIIKTQNIVKRISNSDERLIGTYVGLWLGDETQYNEQNRYTIKICSNKQNHNLNRFIQDLIYKIFNKRTALVKVSSTNQAYIKFKSKFIYNFIKAYTAHDKSGKTYTVKLKKRAGSYAIPFLEGCLLGLTLSDGYLKDKFRFNVTSSRLAKNMYDILKKMKYNPNCYIQMREKDGFKNLYLVYLSRKQSNKLELLLDRVIFNMGFQYSFEELKYGLRRN